MKLKLNKKTKLILLFIFGFVLVNVFDFDKKQVDQLINTINTEFGSYNQTTNREEALVLRVIDGDTIELIGGHKVRYIGIDTPETKHPNKPVECYGEEAYLKNKELVAGKMVKLEKDVSETDRYGRLLRYVYVEGKMINKELVKQGYAKVVSYPPDVKYQDEFLKLEQQARLNKMGLWGEACL